MINKNSSGYTTSLNLTFLDSYDLYLRDKNIIIRISRKKNPKRIDFYEEKLLTIYPTTHNCYLSYTIDSMEDALQVIKENVHEREYQDVEYQLLQQLC